MRNFTYKSLLKYTFCFLSFLIINCISNGVPFAFALLPAFLSLPFSYFGINLIFSGISFIFFSPILALYLTLSAIFLSVIFYLYKRKNKKLITFTKQKRGLAPLFYQIFSLGRLSTTNMFFVKIFL